MTRFPSPTADLLEALGAVVVNFSGLEETLRDALYVLANVECESEGRSVSIMTVKMSFRPWSTPSARCAAMLARDRRLAIP